jgi:hypothetical protein
MKKTVILFIILNLLDCITTYIGVTQGLTEGNFLLNFLFDYNLYLGLIIKMILAGGVVLLLHLLKKQHLYKALNIAFGAIVIWNAVWIILG